MKKISAILATLLISLTFMQSAFAEMFLFVGDGCPHCVVVEQYLQENDLINKFQIKILETWYHPENEVIRAQKAKEVGYEGGGVPFLVNGTEYRIGDTPIISYLDGLRNLGPVNTTTVGSDTTPSDTTPGTLTGNDSNDLKDALADAATENNKSLTDKLKENAIYVVTVVIAIGAVAFFSLRK